jgi:hypothetical protein
MPHRGVAHRDSHTEIPQVAVSALLCMHRQQAIHARYMRSCTMWFNLAHIFEIQNSSAVYESSNSNVATYSWCACVKLNVRRLFVCWHITLHHMHAHTNARTHTHTRARAPEAKVLGTARRRPRRLRLHECLCEHEDAARACAHTSVSRP